MTRMFVRHRVADYAAWREAYDAFDEERRGLGVADQAVYRSVADPNDVTVWHDFSNHEAAESFASSSQLRQAMQHAGVQGAPEIWFTAAA